MTMAVLLKHDSKKFRESVREDPTIDFEAEGGWIISRPLYTKAPARVFTIGFTDMSDADKVALQTLYASVRGSADIIGDWTHPVSSEAIPVRFKKGAVPEFQYKGMGTTYRWDISNVVLEEV